MLARAHKKFLCEQHSEIYLLTLKEKDKTKMELPLDMVSKHAFGTPICRTTSCGHIVFAMLVPSKWYEQVRNKLLETCKQLDATIRLFYWHL